MNRGDQQSLSEISKKISKKWDEFHNFNKPKIFYGLYNGKLYLTSSDDTSIFHFMSDKGKVYCATKSFCTPSTWENVDVYWIENEKFQRLSCVTPFRNVDIFVKEEILPLYFKPH